MARSATRPVSVTVASGRSARDARTLEVGLAAFAAFHLITAALMGFAPHFFFSSIGPFGVRNDHYIRDVATFYAAIGGGLAVAVRRARWRVPVLALTTLQFALHAVNHLVDIAGAHPAWAGYFDFFSLAGATLLLAWLLWLALERRA